ncbi:ribosomal-protein-alanine acetyltransferase [Rhodomicrobium vannielii ATCC 17100]|uniref:Ribosomal-protein-alanine acetyltransferase n=1 Tax=Rhodomicrobium vannielii (strain ATCC 17100 / DSM 162 / LMG 4299 / NCIMB 10020 / ATH 3.1.1) TaxID=648757 RepID=E3I4D0_RHOVT|nr:ribosomal protein S18-alanine N-acetyltransferase [Rhodomicrobium vannielii]ADP70445.1 ribosomal-protein-alanine acetyltransferase [Rhodomicrobium vannielii ATCC 17100]
MSKRSDFLIGRASPEDAATIAALHAEALPPGWPESDFAESALDANRALLKATDRDRPCGFTLFQFAADEAEVLAIAVALDAQGRGHATRLMQAAFELCRERFIACIYLEVAESNGKARGLYEKLGFRVVARRDNYYRHESSASETALVMRLDTVRSAVDPEISSP